MHEISQPLTTIRYVYKNGLDCIYLFVVLTPI